MQNRRTFLKRLAALGVAAPLTSALWRARTTFARGLGLAPRGSVAQAAFASRQLAGQRVIYSYAGLDVPDALVQAIRDGSCAGVIFFGENIADEDQIAGVCARLRKAQEQSPVAAPLLLMTDQEGGLVRRLPGAPERSAKQIGQAADPAPPPARRARRRARTWPAWA